MKVEKISEVQMKFILNKSDLAKRSLQITDLKYGSPKTQELFQDIIDTASRDFSFNIEDIPLMVEAVPTSKSSVMILLTKVPSPITYTSSDNASVKYEKNIEEISGSNTESTSKDETIKKNKKVLINKNDREKIYMFDEIEDLEKVSKQIYKFIDSSSVIKYKSKYALIFSIKNKMLNKTEYIEHIINEYGNKTNVTPELFISYIKENGDIIIKENAVNKLKNM